MLYGNLLAFVVASWTKTPDQAGGIGRLAGHALNMGDATCFQLGFQMIDRIGKLGKNKNFFLRMYLREQFYERRKFRILSHIPGSTILHNRQQGLSISREVFSQTF